MFGTPFCTHTFTDAQLSASKEVRCECGNQYRSDDLREFASLQATLNEAQSNLGSFVRQMAAFNTQSKTATPVAPAVVRPPKPKRERPTLSVTQWLIVAAGFMVLVAASVFVSQNLEKWNVYGWSTLELSLGLLAGFGALKAKKFSILLSNFLAVFSSAMLLTLIMSIGTTFGWGFSEWNNEPAWFWSLNLLGVGAVSLGLGTWSKNFGWRAIAPLSITAGSVVFVTNSVGLFEDRWKAAILSLAIFAVLISVRLSRNAKWDVPKGPDSSYLKDLQLREDNSLKRFGIAASILLAALLALHLLQNLFLNPSESFDGLATLIASAVWLAGARLNKNWVTALVESDSTILTLRNSASAVGLSFAGLGLLSVFTYDDFRLNLGLAVCLVVLAFLLERFAKILLLPGIAVTISAWITIVFAGFWFLNPASDDFVRSLGGYLFAVSLALLVREYFYLKTARTIAIYIANFVGVLSFYIYQVWQLDESTPIFASTFALTLIAVNLIPAVIQGLLIRAKLERTPQVNWVPLVQSIGVVLISIESFLTAETKTYLMAVATGFLLVCLLGMFFSQGKLLGQLTANQAYVAIGIAILLTSFSASVEGLKTQSTFILFDGLLILAYALASKNIRWANVGYAVTSASLIFTTSAWGNQSNAAYLSIAAIGLGAFANLGLVWVAKQFGGHGKTTKFVTRIATAISLVALIELAMRFAPLDSTAYWLLVLIPAGIAIAIEVKTSSLFAFIYAAGALVAAPTFYWPQSEVEGNARIAVALATLTYLLVKRARMREELALGLGAILSGAFFGYFVARVISIQFAVNWDGPELYAIIIASLIALIARLTTPANSRFSKYLQLDLPVLTATFPSLFYSIADAGANAGETENANRFLFAITIIWAHNLWRTFQLNQRGWLIAQSVSGLLFAWALVNAIYVNTKLVWDGPELYSVATLFTVQVGIWLASKQNLVKGSLIRIGLPLAVILTPSVFHSWSSVTKQFGELDLEEITRTILVLIIAIGALIFGTLKANRGLALVGTIELWLIAVPGLWFKTSAIDNGSADLELRGLIIASVIYWAIALLRKYSSIKLKSLVFIGIPVSIALAPAIFHTLSSLGGSELRSVDWWRFSIVLAVSLTLLVVGSLREIGGTFFPGLIGVIVTVLPYGFVPLSNREWFLWAILLGVAALLVWLAVRLENMRKAGREPSAWLKELK